MGYVTDEQVERAKQVDILDYIRIYEPNNIKRVGNSYRLKDHDSLAITDNKWFWHSQGYGGRTALQYLVNVRGYNFVDAVCLLINENPKERISSINNKSKNIILKNNDSNNNIIKSDVGEKIPFKLPLRNQDNKRAIAYLLSRGIEKDIILKCIENGIIYENKPYHNVVFLGKDMYGKTKYASMRCTHSNYKRDVNGSDKRYGFVLPPENPMCNTLAIFEAPIDCLSHMSLCKKGYIPTFDGWRLSLGGTSPRALEYFLQNHKEITHCFINTDNDKAGNEAAAKIIKFIESGEYDNSGKIHNKSRTIKAERAPPQIGVDWNDMLQYLLKRERTTRIEKHKGFEL